MASLKLLTRFDVLVVVVILVAVSVAIVDQHLGETTPTHVLVEVSGKVLYQFTLPSHGDFPIDIDGQRVMTLRISGFDVWLVDSDCPFQRCVYHGRLKGSFDGIVCVPNETVIRYGATPVSTAGPWDVMTR